MIYLFTFMYQQMLRHISTVSKFSSEAGFLLMKSYTQRLKNLRIYTNLKKKEFYHIYFLLPFPVPMLLIFSTSLSLSISLIVTHWVSVWLQCPLLRIIYRSMTHYQWFYYWRTFFSLTQGYSRELELFESLPLVYIICCKSWWSLKSSPLKHDRMLTRWILCMSCAARGSCGGNKISKDFMLPKPHPHPFSGSHILSDPSSTMFQKPWREWCWLWLSIQQYS